MTFLSILFSLLIEQLKPLRADNPIYTLVKLLAAKMESWFNAGHSAHGKLGWTIVILLLMLPTAIIYWLALRLSPFTALVWNVLIVYLTLGFRHYSHYYTSIQLALSNGDDVLARSLLAEWTRQDTAGLEVGEISRMAVENALITTHRNVFGVFFWFLMPLGPACAVMYRVAEYLARAWNEPDHMQNEAFGRFAARAFYWIDWIPARLTAIAFAIVGNFEDAIYAWRNFASRWQDEAVGIILASGSGALGIRLGAPLQRATHGSAADALDMANLDVNAVDGDTPLGEEPNARALQSAVGLVWRALLLWMMLLLMLSMAVWLS